MSWLLKREEDLMELDNCNASTATKTTTKDYEYPVIGDGGFTTSEPGGNVHLYHLNSRTGELIVLGLVLIAWILSVAVFLHRWRHLRILPPRTLLFKDTPKNLDHIKVVTCPADSVIYRGYPSGIASTLQARFNRMKRTFSKRLTNLPLAMTSIRRRPSLGRPSFYGRPCNDGRQSVYERPSHVGRHRISTFYRAPHWSRATELVPTLTPEVMESIPEVMQTIQELATSELEVVPSTPEVMHEIQFTSEVVKSRPEAMKSTTSIPEVATSRPDIVHSKPEVVTSLAEVVIEFEHVAGLKREPNSTP